MQTKKQLALISSNCALCELLTIQKGLAMLLIIIICISDVFQVKLIFGGQILLCKFELKY